MFRLKRLAAGLITKPISLVNDSIKTPSNNLNQTKVQNFYFKSKILILIGLIFFGTNILLSNLLIFNINNYNTFVDSSRKLDLYLDLNRKFFRQRDFLYQFKSFNTKFDYYSSYVKSFYKKSSNEDEEYPQFFNQNYSSVAYLNYLTRIYENEKDPENYLKKNQVGFHWGDWVDLSPALPFVKAYDGLLNSEHFKGDAIKLQTVITRICYDKLFDKKDHWIDEELYNKHVSVWEHLQGINVCASIFKYYYWPIPERITFESDYKYFDIPTKEKRLAKPLGLEGLAKVYHGKGHLFKEDRKDFLDAKTNRGEQMDKLLEVVSNKGIAREDLSLKEVIRQDYADFKRPNFDQLYKNYTAIKKPTPEEKKYSDFLKWSKANVGDAKRFYFTFPWIKIDKKAELHHYTFPWIKQVISHEERIKVVHHLIRSWFKYAEHMGIISWFNYGNLIGWYFNSMNLPWDNDVDVQMSIKDMDKIGRHYNNTLVVEDPRTGDGLFWLQTNPFYLQQNDYQFIDARYIDAKTGIYIDLSALWSDDANPPEKLTNRLGKDVKAFHCKHYNWFGYEEIFPIRRTLYEGAQAYMVNNVTSNLLNLYGNHPLTQKNEQDHNWQEDIGLWVPNEICEGEKVPPTKKRFDDEGNLTLFGACNNTELIEIYKHTKKAWEFSKKEKELIKRNESTAELTSKSLPPFRFYDFDLYR